MSINDMRTLLLVLSFVLAALGALNTPTRFNTLSAAFAGYIASLLLK